MYNMYNMYNVRHRPTGSLLPILAPKLAQHLRTWRRGGITFLIASELPTKSTNFASTNFHELPCPSMSHFIHLTPFSILSRCHSCPCLNLVVHGPFSFMFSFCHKGFRALPCWNTTVAYCCIVLFSVVLTCFNLPSYRALPGGPHGRHLPPWGKACQRPSPPWRSSCLAQIYRMQMTNIDQIKDVDLT